MAARVLEFKVRAEYLCRGVPRVSTQSTPQVPLAARLDRTSTLSECCCKSSGISPVTAPLLVLLYFTAFVQQEERLVRIRGRRQHFSHSKVHCVGTLGTDFPDPRAPRRA